MDLVFPRPENRMNGCCTGNPAEYGILSKAHFIHPNDFVDFYPSVNHLFC